MKQFFDKHPILMRFLLWIFAPLGCACVAVLIFFYQSLPNLNDYVTVTGLDNEVSVFRDEFGIPHISASSDSDAYFALGYLHAQDRLWQMESQRRLGSGRLSEILGRSMLSTDQFMRTLGLHRAASAAAENLSERALEELGAYVAGVNTWIDEKNVLPAEYYILGFQPEYWTIRDSLLQIRLMALNLGSNYINEITSEALLMHFDQSQVSELLNIDINDMPSADMLTAEDERVRAGINELAARLERNFRLGGEWIGSNAWAISGELTENGKSILANDVHTGTQIPTAWYLAEVNGHELHVQGATIPGLPLIVIGRNDKIAWGVTNLVADTQDLFIERTYFGDSNLYEYDGEWHEISVIEEEIAVAADFPSGLREPPIPITWEVRSTRNGPLISDVIDRVQTPMSLRWTALDASDTTYQGFVDVNKSTDLSSFRAAVTGIDAPAINFLYADSAGNIAHLAAGKIPVRRRGSGMFPVPGWLAEFQWDTTIPRNQLPHSVNPPEGFLVNANNKVHDDSYSFFISHNWAENFRAERVGTLIREKLSRGESISLEFNREMQSDVVSRQAVRLVEFLIDLDPGEGKTAKALELLGDWDGAMSIDSLAASIFQGWLRNFRELLIDDELKMAFQYRQRAQILENYSAQLSSNFLFGVMEKKYPQWCDDISTDEQETCEEIALQAMELAIKELELSVGKQMSRWEWGDIHRTSYPHLTFSEHRFLELFFNRSIPNGGDSNTVNSAAFTYDKSEQYRQTQGPSYRQIVEVGSSLEGGYITNTGQSGNVVSPHYDNFIEPHRNNQLLPMNIDGNVSDAAKLLLSPGYGLQ